MMNTQCSACNNLDDSSEFFFFCFKLGIDVDDNDTKPVDGECSFFRSTPSPCATCDYLDSVCATGNCNL